jgi:hypothetical protein
LKRFVFRVNLVATVRVLAADETEARKVVPSVLLAPGPDEIRVANDNNAKIGWDASIAAVDYRVKGDPLLITIGGKRIKRA